MSVIALVLAPTLAAWNASSNDDAKKVDEAPKAAVEQQMQETEAPSIALADVRVDDTKAN